MATDTTRATITPTQIAGVTLGNGLEFYDFLVFTFFAVQIGETFFPAANPQSSLLAALATFGAGFLTRPLGAVVIGGIGDRIGRRPAMLLSFALIGAASLAVALTPGYATLGWAAPVLVILWRLIQGFALGGEVGPSTAFLAEAAPPDRRALYISLQFVGQNVAVLLAGLIGVALAAAMDDKALTAWGWRIAMAIGVLIVPIGLALRRTLPETIDVEQRAAPPPAITHYARAVVFAFVVLLSGTIVTYVMNFLTTFARTTLHLPSGVAFGATVAVGVAGTVGSVVGGLLADRYGRKPVMVAAMLIVCLATMPCFWLLVSAPSAWPLWLIATGLRLAASIAFTASLVSVTEGFPPRVRSAALSIVYAVAISVFGGSTQFVVAWLTKVTANPLAPAWYMTVAALIGLAAMLTLRETRRTIR